MKEFVGQHKFNPYIQETSRTVEIKDNFGKVRYKVSLSETEDVFQITVVSYCYGEEPETVVSKVESEFAKAIQSFNYYVDTYSALLKAETKDTQDVWIWADKTGYHKICPDCCRRCKFAQPVDSTNSVFEDWKNKFKEKFFCMNSDLYKIEGRQERTFNDIRPIVEPDGLCDGFLPREADKYRLPNHSDYAVYHHDFTPENRIETIARFEFGRQYDEFKQEMLSTVGQEIEKQMNVNPPVIEGNKDQDGAVYGGGAQ